MALDTQNQKRFKLCVPLVQMTPIYHFQADEAGATLRATEVKPKLDRYLIHAAFGNKPENFKHFCIGGDAHSQDSRSDDKHYALDYRLSITVDDPSTLKKENLYVEVETRNGSRLEGIGSIWDTDKLPSGTMLEKDATVTLHFFSRHSELIEVIDSWIDAFFAGENFGCRQSKGFGSFITEACNSDFARFEAALEKHMNTTEFATNTVKIEVPYAILPTTVYAVHSNEGKEKQAPKNPYLIADVLNDIRDIHRIMKSGYNMPHHDKRKKVYISSYLLKIYTKKHDKLKELDNEKRVMKIGTLLKVKGLTLPDEKQNFGPLKQERRFYRALLGLPSFYEFRKLRYGSNDKCVARITITDDEPNEQKIARFRSPITYKPVLIAGEWRCYLIPLNIPKEMFGHRFSFALAQLKGGTGYNIPPVQRIKTPTSEEFNLLHFLAQFTAEPQIIRESVKYDFSRHQAECTFGHLTIKKEERPDE